RRRTGAAPCRRSAPSRPSPAARCGCAARRDAWPARRRLSPAASGTPRRESRRGGWRKQAGSWLSPSVVVDELDVFGVAVRPAEAEAELVVDADRMLAGPVALQRLEPVGRRNAQIVQG